MAVGGTPARESAAGASNAQLAEAHKAYQAAMERADKAEGALAEGQHAQTKLQAKLAAVTTLYTEAMQREAALKVLLEQAQG
mmetsp:Transcript_21453/g.46136  ORF Transcript_21453/g.46136 Transcript_21453/m.46136 type:complete len:82 (+) Transcript_21453:2-247(+)